MANNTQTTPGSEGPEIREYKRKGKFFDWVGSSSLVNVAAMRKRRKQIIELLLPTNDGILNVLVTNGYVGQLGEFLSINSREMNARFDASRKPWENRYASYDQKVTESDAIEILNADWLQKLLANEGNRLMKISAHQGEDGTWWAHTIATEIHQTITFTQIGKVVRNILGDDVTEDKINYTKVWELKSAEFGCKNEQFNSIIRVTSGRNTKAQAIKVIVLVRVSSCNNSIVVADYTAIKRTTNALERLEETLLAAVEIVDTVEATIIAGMEKELTLEQGFEYIDGLKMGIRIPEKVEHIKEVLKQRFAHEYEKYGNNWALSQALSYVGTHDDPAQSTERTLADLQMASYQVLTQ